MLKTKVFYCCVNIDGRTSALNGTSLQGMMNDWMEAIQLHNVLEIVSAIPAMGGGGIHEVLHSMTVIYKTTPK
jgi:hypothetical protein